jgi:hypothetical protein
MSWGPLERVLREILDKGSQSPSFLGLILVFKGDVDIKSQY